MKNFSQLKKLGKKRKNLSNATLHKIDWITITRCLLCLAFLYAQVISLMKVLERSRLRLLEKSIPTTLLLVYCVHSAWGYVPILVYPIFSYACCCCFTWNNSNIFVSVPFVHRLMWNDITLLFFRNNILFSTNLLALNNENIHKYFKREKKKFKVFKKRY